MRDRFGEQYDAYCRKVPRFAPSGLRCSGHTRIRGLGVVLALTFVAAQAQAQCTMPDDARAVLRSATKEMRCRYKRLKQGPTAECTLDPAPACAGTLVADTVALAYGVNAGIPAAAVDPRAVKDQLRCQKLIGIGSANFIGLKLRYLVRGFTPAEAEARARNRLDKPVL